MKRESQLERATPHIEENMLAVDKYATRRAQSSSDMLLDISAKLIELLDGIKNFKPTIDELTRSRLLAAELNMHIKLQKKRRENPGGMW